MINLIVFILMAVSIIAETCFFVYELRRDTKYWDKIKNDCDYHHCHAYDYCEDEEDQ